MIIDKDLELCLATAIDTGTAGADLTGNAIRTQRINMNLAVGKPMYCVIRVDTSVTSGGAMNVTFALRSDDNATVHTTTSTLHASTGAIAKATLVAGYTKILILPPGVYEEYLGLIVTTDTNDATAGKIDAWITDNVSQWVSTADALSAP
jgi:hypothetical protein